MLHSGVMVDGILFDVGERSYLERGPKAIFLTHLHVDHAFFTEQEAGPLPAPAYAPQRWEGHPEIRLAQGTRDVDGVAVTAVPTVHSNTYRSCAYIMDDGVSRIMYTGDLITIKRRYRDRIPELDLVITDGAFLRRGGLVRRDGNGRPHGHNGIPDLVRLFSPVAKRIVFTHFGSWFFHDVDDSIRRISSLSNASTVEAARDGMVIEL